MKEYADLTVVHVVANLADALFILQASKQFLNIMLIIFQIFELFQMNCLKHGQIYALF
jgi:hypothetical protein